MKKTLQLLAFLFPFFAEAQGLILNELSNGTAGVQEYMEFVVVGSAANPLGTVNLSGWIIDDNNGNFEALTSGVGIASGHVRIASGCLTAVKPGSILVFYNNTDRNAAIPADDPTDANSDCVYIIPISSACIQGCSTFPNTSNASYTGCSYGAANWNTIGMANGGDVGQARQPNGTFFHGFSYGDVTTPSAPSFPAALGGGSGFSLSGSGASGVFFFNSGNFTSSANFTRGTAGTSAENPGAPNNNANRYFINSLRSGTYNYSNLNAASNTGSSTVLQSCLTVLPIYLSRFEAEKQGEQAILNWVVESATTNIFDFELQRSNDGITFVPLAFMAGKTTEANYTWVDEQPLAQNYYRLKMIDANGEVSYSAIRHLSFEQFAGSINIYPNPLTGNRLLNIETQSRMGKLRVYNSLGQMLLESNLDALSGQLQLPTEWAAGCYTLLLELDGNSVVRKLIIE